jgi:drug/metabolite transporter (DMT)-like permease
MNPWTPLVLAMLGWGSAAVLTRAALTSGVSSFTVVAIRFGIASITLVLVSRGWARFRPLGRRQWGRGTLLGVIALIAPNTLFTLGLEDLPVNIGGLLIALIPIATVGAAHFLVEGERFDPRSIPGLVVSLMGTGILVGLGGESVQGVGDLWRGVGLSLGGVFLAGIGGALTRRFALELGGDGLVIPEFVTATAVGALMMPFFNESPLSTLDAQQWGLLLALGLAATAVPFTAFLVGAQVNPASRLAVVTYLVPVIAVSLAVIALGETLTATVALGAAMIIGGVILTERSSRHVPVPGADIAE